MKKGRIYILSGPIRTGKTTFLMDLIKHREDVGGVLSPDINGVRHFFSIVQKEYRSFEVGEGADTETISIGRFTFDQSAFKWALDQLNTDLNNNLPWIIVDEVGPLELREQGLWSFVERLGSQGSGGNVVMVVREGLVERVAGLFPWNVQRLESREELVDLLNLN